MNNTHAQSEYCFTIRSLVEDIIAVDFKEDSLQATSSFLIPDANGEELPLLQSQGEERRTTTNAHDILISQGSIIIRRKSDREIICELCNPTVEGMTVKCDRSFPFYGIGANNWSESIDRRGKNIVFITV